MSPGATFERVYNELKRMLAEGELPPASPIEPALIGRQIASSITPIRDALHRLTGERLVDAPNHNGFRVPLPTEAGLRDMYHWNGQLLTLALRTLQASFNPQLALQGGQRDIAASAARFFLRIAEATGSSEHVEAITRLNDRLAPFRRIEAGLLQGVEIELEQLAAADGRTELAKLLTAYHRRRMRAVPDMLAYRG